MIIPKIPQNSRHFHLKSQDCQIFVKLAIFFESPSHVGIDIGTSPLAMRKVVLSLWIPRFLGENWNGMNSSNLKTKNGPAFRSRGGVSETAGIDIYLYIYTHVYDIQ